MSEYEFVTTLTLVFVVAAGLSIGASRHSLPVVPFYLLAGVLVGAVIDEGQLLDLAQWGIAFLVFAFAVELEPLADGGLERDSALVSVAQLLATGTVTFALALSIGFEPLNAVYFAVAASFGSSLVALRLLERRVRLRSLHERLAESIHFVEDVFAIAVVLALNAFVYADDPLAVLGVGAALIVAGVLIRRTLFDRIASFAEGDVEILMLTGISLIIGFIALAEFAGVSIVVGAFAAGLAVASDYPHDVEVVDAIGYLEDFFAPIFFVTLGALVSISSLVDPRTIGLALALVLAVLVLNPAVTYVTLRWRAYDTRTAALTGYGVDSVSEFALVIAIEALAAELILPELFDAVVVAAIVTMLASTVTHRYADAGYRRLVETGLLDPDREDVRARSRVPTDLSDHVIVTGYDREGQQIVEACEAADHPCVVVESDPRRRETVREHCEYYVFGDSTTESVWKVANADRALLIVATTPRRTWAERVLSLDVGADTIVRAADVETGRNLLERGALFVAVPDVLAAERLREHVDDLLSGEMTREELREYGARRLEQAVEYGPSDEARIR